MRRRFRIASIFLLGILFGFPAQLHSADQWVRVKSKNFTLVGNAKEKKIRQAAAHLEQFRAGLSLLLSLKSGPSPIPTVVVVFKDDKAFEAFKPMEGGKILPLAGYFQPGEDVNYIALSPETAHDHPYAIIFHEFVHQLVHEMIDNPPVWFNEGLAEYYSTFEVGKDGREVRVGRPIASHIQLLRTTSSFPISALLNSSRELFRGHDRESRGYSYAQAWVFVHYLLLGNNKIRQPQFIQFVRACIDGREEPDEHFERVFKADYETMEKELIDYVHRQSFPYSVYQLKDRLAFESDMTAEPIPAAEAEYYLGDLLLHGNRLIQAESYLRQALARDPNQADARASLGVLRLRQNRVADARKELAEAVRSETVRPAARYFYVRSLMQPDTGNRFSYCDPATREIVLAQLRRVIEEMPSFGDSYNLLGYMELTSDSDLDEAMTMLKRGISLQPRRKEYLLTLAQLQLKKRETAAAKQTLEALLAGTRDEGLQSLARDLLAQAAEFERFEERHARSIRETEGEPPAGDETPGGDEAGAGSLPERVDNRASQTRAETTVSTARPRPAVKAPGTAVVDRPDCYPTFIDVRGHSSIKGTLIRVDTLTGSPDFVLLSGGTEYVFLTPKTGTPLIYSCRIRLGPEFDYTELHHAAVVYFDPVSNAGYAGRAVAIEILSTEPLPAN